MPQDVFTHSYFENFNFWHICMSENHLLSILLMELTSPASFVLLDLVIAPIDNGLQASRLADV